MKEIRLKRLSLKNFKGGSLTIEPDGHDTDVFGDNKSGKTRLADAFYWLLFNKDSLDQANFQIKTVDENGEVVSGDEEHMVEAVLIIDGVEKSLKKVHTETWVRHRGDAHDTFTGNKNDYYVDGVPLQEKEFKRVVDDICPELTFKLLTNPRFFNEVLTTYNGKKCTQQEARRKLLFEVCGVDLSDEDVIRRMFPDGELDPGYAAMIEILKKRSFDDHRKIAKERQTKINKELDKIPARIDERTRDKDDSLRDYDTVLEEIKSADKVLRKKKEALSAGAISDLKKKLAEAEASVIDRETQLKKDHQILVDAIAKERQEKIDKATKNVETASKKVSDQKAKQREVKDKNAELEKDITSLEKNLAELRSRFNAEAEKTFVPDVEGICSRCGQPIPEEDQKAASEKALAEFNEAQADTFKAINEEGIEKKAILELRQASLKKGLDELEKINEKLVSLESQKSDLSKALTEIIEVAPVEPKQHPDKTLNDLKRAVETIKGKIDHIKEVDSPDTTEAQAEVDEAEKALDDLKAEKLKIEAAATSEKRVEELRDEENNLAKEFERLEHELYLIGEFEQAKTRMIEDSINDKFLITRFKLFEKQINGGIEPVCVATHDGVQYNTMNNASRLNVGIDIQNVLSSFYGISMVKFVDNAESVTQLLESGSQTIRLIVSDKDKELRFEGR
jgi:DNA repair exonuclease SbcCD ATPase subunit